MSEYPTVEEQSRNLSKKLNREQMYAHLITPNIFDPTRHATLKPVLLDRLDEMEDFAHSYYKFKSSREKIKKEDNRPFLFKICNRLSTDIKNILK